MKREHKQFLKAIATIGEQLEVLKRNGPAERAEPAKAASKKKARKAKRKS